MDADQPASFAHRTASLSTARTYHFVDHAPDAYDPARHPTLLCVHGFPDLWYGWRYQIKPWVAAGFRVVVPDMLGYGASDKPLDPVHYSAKKLAADLAALLDLLALPAAVLVGHDWGAHVVTRFAHYYPHRVRALVTLSVPYSPPTHKYISVEDLASRVPNLGYQVYFSKQRATSEILANLSPFLDLIFQSPNARHTDFTPVGALEKSLKQVSTDIPSVLSKQEMDYYRSQLGQDMNGPLNYYRTSKHRHDEELTARLPRNLPEHIPVLFIWGTEDKTIKPELVSRASSFIRLYQDVAIKGCGHWLMVEARDEVTETIQNWLRNLDLSTQPRSTSKL